MKHEHPSRAETSPEGSSGDVSEIGASEGEYEGDVEAYERAQQHIKNWLPTDMDACG